MKSKLVIEMDENDDIHIEPKNINIRQLVLAGGTDIDTVKDQLLDVYLAAMDGMTEKAIRQSRSVRNGG